MISACEAPITRVRQAQSVRFSPRTMTKHSVTAAMIRNDTGCVLLPLLPEATHPAIRRLAEFVSRKEAGGSQIGRAHV